MPRGEREWDKLVGADFMRLCELLRQLPPGVVADAPAVIDRLQACWRQFDGSDQQRTTPDKLRRAERLHWRSPYLTFTLARHGGLAAGSTAESLHEWEVDIDSMTATLTIGGQRQIGFKSRTEED